MRTLRILLAILTGLVALAAAVSARRRQEAQAGAQDEHGAHRAPYEDTLIRMFERINQSVEWHRLPTWIGVLNLLALRIVLRERNLYDTSAKLDASREPMGRPEPKALYTRTVDGTYNDLQNPRMGMAGERFGRNVPLEHTYPEDEPELLSPSPRVVSSKLLARDTFQPATILNLLAAAWIQFQIHDWFNHGDNQTDNHLQIELEDEDDWFERPMRVRRTAADGSRTSEEEGDAPTYRNAVSHWWDASAVYGCDRETCDRLRAWVDGKLVLENGRLPLDPKTGLSITGFNDNWWIGLGLMHTLFTMEHNAICEKLKREYPQWSDERLYQVGRLINAALMAKIHTIEWTPAILQHPALQIGMNANWYGLGTEALYRIFGRIGEGEEVSGIPGSPADHHGAPFTLTEEFASVYRLHPLIPDDFEFYSMESGEMLKRLTFPEVALRNAANVIDDRLRVEDVYYSFGIAHPGAITLHNFPNFLRDHVTEDGVRLDIAAVDIMRDRERGVPRYNQFRRLFHMPPMQSFEDLTPNKQWQQELREVYNNDIERVDLMVGMYAETPPKGFGFSDTAFRVFILMASRRLKSDRFFTGDYNRKVYTKVGLDWINDNSMIDILLRHYPELTPALRGVDNAFKPWSRVH